MHMGPEEIIVVIPLTFREDMLVREVNVAIRSIRQDIQSHLPVIKQLYMEPKFDD